MIWIIIGAAIVLVMIVFWIVSKGGIYRRIFAAEHFVEFANSLAAATAAGCDKINEPPGNPPTKDPRVFVTSAGLAVMYTVGRENGNYEHHFSISIAGRYTPHAVGGTFTVYVARLLGVDLADLHVGISQGNVYHSAFTLTQDQQATFSDRIITIPSLDDAGELHTECMDVLDRLQFERFDTNDA